MNTLSTHVQLCLHRQLDSMCNFYSFLWGNFLNAFTCPVYIKFHHFVMFFTTYYKRINIMHQEFLFPWKHNLKAKEMSRPTSIPTIILSDLDSFINLNHRFLSAMTSSPAVLSPELNSLPLDHDILAYKHKLILMVLPKVIVFRTLCI